MQKKERRERLANLAKTVAVCPRCPALVANRTQPVFGVGNPSAKIFFVGEAPGREEDLQGEPFVGRAGRLLNDWLTHCGLRRPGVYICNAVKCRPPDNRTPLAHELANCRPYLDEQLAIIRPAVVCTLGGVAAQSLLEIKAPLARLRGRVHEYQKLSVVCTYHPAYVARTPSAWRDVRQDLKLLMAEAQAKR